MVKRPWTALLLTGCFLLATVFGFGPLAGVAHAAPPIEFETRLPIIQLPISELLKPVEIRTVKELRDIWSEKEMAGHYILMNDLDLKDVKWTEWISIGKTHGPFTGTFNGNNRTIYNMSTLQGGLFSDLDGHAVVKNLTFRDVSVHGGGGALATTVGPNVTIDGVDVKGGRIGSRGGLVSSNAGRIVNSMTDVQIVENGFTGGLVGTNTGTIENSWARGEVINTSGGTAGGLVGLNSGVIRNSYATGVVHASANLGNGMGGLVGRNEGTIEDSHASGKVNGQTKVGGLVGLAAGGSIVRSYATGAVTGNNHVGGLVGQAESGASISDTYATGAVSGGEQVGGLIGAAVSAKIARSYTISQVKGTLKGGEDVAGLIGQVSDAVSMTSLRWHTGLTGQTASLGGGAASPHVIGLNDDEMTVAASYDGWDFTALWGIDQGKEYPHFASPGVRGTGPMVFVDIRDHWAADDIMKMAKAGVISGVGGNKFDPDGDVTRAQFAKIIVLGLGLKPSLNPRLTFADTAQIPDWAHGYVATAVQEGIIQGLDGNRFGPNMLVTREQIAVMVARAGRLRASDAVAPPVPDLANVSDWAREEVKLMIIHRLMRFHDTGDFNPKTPATRAEATSAVARVQPFLPPRP